ncbi:MAG TPA: hypothetical protein VKS60_24090 [Stellaceae bacterium]|nr:hypothetical protein [Stellaceae bacterium]
MSHAEFLDYEIVALADGTWGVKVSPRGRLPHTETGFATKQEAEAWILAAAERPDGDQGLPSFI